MNKTVGLIGLGNIGGGICTRLIDLGYQVVGYDVSTQAAERAAAKGAKIAASPRQLAADVPVILSSLPNPGIVLDVFTGAGGVIDAAQPNTVIIETSTIDPN